MQVAYTFDAGPNACLFTLRSSLSDLLAHILIAFPNLNKDDNYIRGIKVEPASSVNLVS